MNPKVDILLSETKQWKDELTLLRQIALESGLNETIKWGQPCYTLQNSNIVLIHGFKEYCAFLFFKGALLKDPDNLLIQQTENVQAARQIRFTTLADIQKLKSKLGRYIQQAIDVEKAGLKVELKKHSEYEVPEEFQKKCDENPELKKAFQSLTPGRQRAYLMHFGQAKQVKTRESRIEACMSQILAGKGLND